MRSRTSPEVSLLVICLIAVTTCYFAGCGRALKIPAAYIEHTGDEDKPVDPIVIATRRPSEREIRRALTPKGARLNLMFVHVFLVKDEELAQVGKLVRESLASTKPTDHLNDFRYVIVSGNREVEISSLDYQRSRQLFAALTSYFDGRQPQLHEYLTDGMNWFWYVPSDKNSSRSLRQKFPYFGTILPPLYAERRLGDWASTGCEPGPEGER